ncbi:MAG: DEAD/DEAH box helicase [Nanoarchaeota archaeon]
MDKFRKLGINPEILKSLEEQKIHEPTEIQEKTIELVLAGKDIIAGAATGSGKTLAFGTGIIQNSDKCGMIQALVLVPTRELADQVAKSLKLFSKYKHLSIIEIFGGVSMGPQVDNLRIADVVVATPGRMLDHIGRETVNLNNVKMLILDEADRMLDMGFIEDVKKIIRACPQKRQTMLFSATISHEIRRISDKYMNSPVEIMAETQVDPSKLKQVFYDVPDNMKFSLLVHLLRQEKKGSVMVFCNTQRNTDFVTKNLQSLGINALAIHGGYSQDKRSRTMEKFHSKDFEVLVCTDVAARGLDIKGVSHVYNYDIPREPNQYIHRIGRTARAGSEGIAVNILASRDYENFSQVKKHNDVTIERLELPEMQRVSIGFKEHSSGGRFEDRGRGRFGGSGRSRFGGGRSGRFGHSRNSDSGDREDRRESHGRSGGSRFSRSDRRESRGRFHGRY